MGTVRVRDQTSARRYVAVFSSGLSPLISRQFRGANLPKSPSQNKKDPNFDVRSGTRQPRQAYRGVFGSDHAG